MTLSLQDIVSFYCNRGCMENFIKKSNNEFGFASMSSHSMLINANRLQIFALAYNIFNAFQRLCLPKKLRALHGNALRLSLLKIANRRIKTERKAIFQFCSSYAHIQEFYDIFHTIQKLAPQLE